MISYWSLYHTVHISKISLQCCPHSNCWCLRHDWSPSYTNHIYTDPPWGEWAHQQEGRSADWSSQHTPRHLQGFLLWVGSLVGLHMWALTQALPILTTHMGFLSYLQLLLKFKIRAKVDAFSILIRDLTFWVDDAMLGCVPHKVFSTITVVKCHLAFVYFLITMVMRSFSWCNDHMATVNFLCQFADNYSDNSDSLRSIFLQKSQEVWIWSSWLLTLLELSPWSFPTQFSSSATSADSPAHTRQEESTCFSNLDFLPCRPIIESWLIYLWIVPISAHT